MVGILFIAPFRSIPCQGQPDHVARLLLAPIQAAPFFLIDYQRPIQMK